MAFFPAERISQVLWWALDVSDRQLRHRVAKELLPFASTEVSRPSLIKFSQPDIPNRNLAWLALNLEPYQSRLIVHRVLVVIDEHRH
jgi:hypothetical protein